MATASNSSLTQSSTQSVSPSVLQANTFEPKQVTVAGGIILAGALVEAFKWGSSNDTGNASFIPENLKEINEISSVSIETPTGTPISQIPNPPRIDELSGQISSQSTQAIPLQTGTNLLASQTGVLSNSTPTPPDPQQSEASTELKTPEQKNQVSGNLPRINSFFEPKLIPQNISIDVNELNKVDQEKIRQDLGFAPFIWYSDIQIEYKDIKSFTLKYDNSLPTISLIFNDSFGIMKKKGFPADDTLITIFLNSRSKNLRSIKLDFKVYTFTDMKNGSYSINGIIDIPLLYTRKFESFPIKSSHEVLREVAKNLGCGFCSNINDTNDRMCWINPGNSSLRFIKDVLKNSYVSDDTFLFSYVDFYYNLCYVDLNKELTRNINQDLMVNAAGFDKVKAEGSGAEEKIVPLQLSNDPSFEGSNGFISEYSILNNSTKISIFNSYRTRSQSWNYVEKEVCQFDIETITPDGKDLILLKGRSDDSFFFRENVDRVWLGKRDSDNSHVNYNYSELQNRLNLEELAKIGARLTLPTPNLNLYLFQKVKVIFSVKKLTPTNEEQFMPRLTGDWLIVGIELNYINGRVSQVLSVIKTSLSLTPEEAEKAVAQVENKETEVAERNQNEEVPATELPSCAELKSPSNGAKDQANLTKISWSEALNATGYDVYFGDSQTPPLVSENQPLTTFDPNVNNIGLKSGTTFYWRIVPRNSLGTAECNTVWNFKTKDDLPLSGTLREIIVKVARTFYNEGHNENWAKDLPNKAPSYKIKVDDKEINVNPPNVGFKDKEFQRIMANSGFETGSPFYHPTIPPFNVPKDEKSLGIKEGGKAIELHWCNVFTNTVWTKAYEEVSKGDNWIKTNIFDSYFRKNVSNKLSRSVFRTARKAQEENDPSIGKFGIGGKQGGDFVGSPIFNKNEVERNRVTYGYTTADDPAFIKILLPGDMIVDMGVEGKDVYGHIVICESIDKSGNISVIGGNEGGGINKRTLDKKNRCHAIISPPGAKKGW